MDLVKAHEGVLERKKKDLEEESKGVGVVVFGTSIYDESLYRVGQDSSEFPFHMLTNMIRHGRV